MRFSSIQIENFRQFEGVNYFEFSKDKSITLIIAQNGVGKTTFLQAFRYCFYGENPNYLKLPNSFELLNFNTKDSILEGQSKVMSVEVKFEDNNRYYIARRDAEFIKRNGRLTKNESFTMWMSTGSAGFRSIEISDADILIRTILPPGLSHIYLFDGERMERRVESVEYKKDLREAIIGVLGIKKLNEAINYLGSKRDRSLIIGKINALIEAKTDEETNILLSQGRIQEKILEYKEELKSLMKQKEDFNERITKLKEAQERRQAYNNQLIQRDKIEVDIKELKLKLETLGFNGTNVASKVLKYIGLVKNYYKYQLFLEKANVNDVVYQSLHEDTIKDILTKGVCICGEEIHENTDKYHRLKHLSVLPYDNVHFLNKINNEFSSVSELSELIAELKEIKINITKTKRELRQKDNALAMQIASIRDFEVNEYGESSQEDINLIIVQQSELSSKIGVKERELEVLLKNEEKNNILISELSQKTEKNERILKAVKLLESLSDEIKNEVKDKEESARQILEGNMNETINKLMVGDFTVSLSSKFELDVTQTFKGTSGEISRKHTDILSTGQSVMVSLSFIESLLKTLKQFQGKDASHYNGVIMDAALSNVDETHIKNVCNYLLNKLDQVIFLSYRRQLRDELFSTISDKVGISYILRKNSVGSVESEIIDVSKIKEFIHQKEQGDSDE